MGGAFMRIERERALVWYSAMLPHLKKPPSLDDFTGRKSRGPKRQTMEQMILTAQCWDAAVNAANLQRSAKRKG